MHVIFVYLMHVFVSNDPSVSLYLRELSKKKKKKVAMFDLSHMDLA